MAGNFGNQVGSLYLRNVQSDNVRMNTLAPAAGTVGVSVVAGKAAYGAWIQLLAAGIADPCWLFAVCAFPITVDVEVEYDVQVGVGAACAESARATVSISQKSVTAAGVALGGYASFPVPIRIPAAPRIAARGASNDCGATRVIETKALFATGVGT